MSSNNFESHRCFKTRSSSPKVKVVQETAACKELDCYGKSLMRIRLIGRLGLIPASSPEAAFLQPSHCSRQCTMSTAPSEMLPSFYSSRQIRTTAWSCTSAAIRLTSEGLKRNCFRIVLYLLRTTQIFHESSVSWSSSSILTCSILGAKIHYSHHAILVQCLRSSDRIELSLGLGSHRRARSFFGEIRDG